MEGRARFPLGEANSAEPSLVSTELVPGEPLDPVNAVIIPLAVELIIGEDWRRGGGGVVFFFGWSSSLLDADEDSSSCELPNPLASCSSTTRARFLLGDALRGDVFGADIAVYTV